MCVLKVLGRSKEQEEGKRKIERILTLPPGWSNSHNKREGSQPPPPPPPPPSPSTRSGGGSLDKAVAMETEDQVGYQRGPPAGCDGGGCVPG